MTHFWERHNLNTSDVVEGTEAFLTLAATTCLFFLLKHENYVHNNFRDIFHIGAEM